MTPTLRPYQSEDDFWRMREFLRRVFLLNDRLERSWHVTQLDYARWHTALNCAHVGLEDVTFLWEAEGEIIRSANAPSASGQDALGYKRGSG